METQQKREIVNFPNNVPTTITLDTAPASAKMYERVSKKGNKYSTWMYWTTDGKIFFAMKDLHQQLQSFHRGDTVTITNVVPVGEKYGTLKVDGGHGVGSASDTDKFLSDLAQGFNTLNKKMDTIIEHIKNANKDKEHPWPTPADKDEEKDIADLGF